MSLRRQLLMVSLLLLALPWAGCQFVREIEGTMREGQVQSLQATTSAIATALRDRPRLLYPDPRRAPTLPADDGSIYAHPSDVPIIVDGYADGWEESHRTTLRGAFDAAELTLHYQAQTRNGNLYLLFQVEDADVVFNNPELSREANGDRLMLQTWLDDKRQRYVIATSAPGAVRAKFDGRRHPGVNPARIRGVWQDSTNGYTIELEIPLSMTGERLGFYITNASSGAGAALDTVGNTSPLRTAAPPWLIYSPDTLHKALEPFGHLGGSLSVFDRGNFQLGKASSAPTLAEYDETSKQETFWLIKALYRSILAEDPLPTVPATDDKGQQRSDEISAALAGRAESRWYSNPADGTRAILSAAAPVFDHNIAIGAVVVRQNSEQYLSLTDRAFSRLLAYSFLAIAIASFGLLGYASVLSWRIRSLSQAVANVVRDDRSVDTAFPRSRAGDEIGELSRRYADLLGQLGEYNDYLRTLSSKLSHELRTPVAVIQSSLDNLEQPGLDAKEQHTYIIRARDGLNRLAGILTAMSEASRVEESLYSSKSGTFDLVPLLTEVCEAYRSVYNKHKIHLDCAEPRAQINGSPDLLVQALDKLVDNAASFSTPGDTIVISLNSDDGHWQIAVSNRGPNLPEDLQTRLFEPMVSLRDADGEGRMHLGLGLHVVRLIAQHFQGSVSAQNLPDGSGVRITLEFPKA